MHSTSEHAKCVLAMRLIATVQLIYVRVSICIYVGNIPLPLQLSGLDLGGNLLVGTLPESWSHLTNVSHCENISIS